MARFQQFGAFGPQTADLGSFTAGFQHIGSFGSQTANLRSFMATFQHLSKVAMKLPTLAVSWPDSSNCQPWQFYGRFSAPIKSGHETADLGSFMATNFTKK